MTQVPTFEELFRGSRTSALHLEMRDTYMPSDPAFVDWSAGKTIVPADRWADWLSLVQEATSRGVEVRRARVVSTPVNAYIKFEYDVTDGLNIAAGEQVRWLSRREATDLALPGNDFWLLDSELVLVNHFDGDSENMEMEVSESSELARLCGTAFEAVWKRATPHAEFRPR